VTRTKKSTIRRLLLSLAVFAVASFSVPVFVHRHEFDKAFVEWRRNPTPRSEAILDAQGRENQKAVLETQAVATLVMWVIFNGVWIGVRELNSHIRGEHVSKNA
jgi:uncharacterized membrane protein YccF (DUF307 family)